MKAILDKIGSNFFVAAFVPSLGFMLITGLLFGPSLPKSVAARLQNSLDPLDSGGLLLLILALILGFVLSSLSGFTQNFFQGEIFNCSFKINKHKKKAEEYCIKNDELKEELDEIKHQIDSIGIKCDKLTGKDEENDIAELCKKRDEIENKIYANSVLYQRYYPPSDLIKSTKYGNITVATDYYIAVTYGIDNSLFWHQLISVIPEGYKNEIDQSRNSLLFVLNSALLSLVFSGIGFLAVIYEFICLWAVRQGRNKLLYFILLSLNEDVHKQRAEIYILFVALGVLVFFLLHFIANKVVLEYSTFIRDAYALFRLELLEKFRLELPENSADEFYEWKNLGELIALGAHSLDFEWLEYHHPDSKNDVH